MACYVIKHGLQWQEAPREYGPPKTLYNRFIRWTRRGVFDRMFATLAGQGPKPDRIKIESTHLKAHRTAASLLKRGFSLCIGRTKGWLDSRFHVVCDGDGTPLVMLQTEGQMSDDKRARMMLKA
jgi:transposase